MAAKPLPITKQQRDLWVELNTTIRECAGAVVSLPDTNPIRFECEQGSDLPWHLSRCGYEVRSMGTNDRLWPFNEVIQQRGTTRTISHVRPTTVAVFELELPAPPSDDRRSRSTNSNCPAENVGSLLHKIDVDER
jgi:hypothetical protein